MISAMQEYIEFLKNQSEILMPETRLILMDKAIKLLEKEKQQITIAYQEGTSSVFTDTYDADYYENTYNKVTN